MIHSPWAELPGLLPRHRELSRSTGSHWNRLCGTGSFPVRPLRLPVGEDPQFGLLPHPRRWVSVGLGGDADTRYGRLLAGELGDPLAVYDLTCVRARGSWRGSNPFVDQDMERAEQAELVSLDCSNNRWHSMHRLWLQGLPGIVHQLAACPGNLGSVGVYHFPTLDAVSLAHWQDMPSLMEFAYGKGGAHLRAVHSARRGGWFVETFFGIFRVERSWGQLGKPTVGTAS